MWVNQTHWFNTVVTPNPSMLVFMSLSLRLSFMAVEGSGDGERETLWWSLLFFLQNPCFISPKTRSLAPLSVSPRAPWCISLLHELFLLDYAISISSHLNPFSLPALLLSLLSWAYISSLSLGSLFK